MFKMYWYHKMTLSIVILRTGSIRNLAKGIIERKDWFHQTKKNLVTANGKVETPNKTVKTINIFQLE